MKLNKFQLTKALEDENRDLETANKVIDCLFEMLGQQARAILDIREKMTLHAETIEMLAGTVFPSSQQPKLVGFEEPKLIIPPMPDKVN